jgi:hypothetical protein
MIVCWRTVHVPPEVRGRFLAWIQENRRLRQDHGILFELVLERSSSQNPTKTLQPAEAAPAEEGEAVVLTAWASHEAFDAWIETPDRDRLTASAVLGSVRFGPITRHDVAGGYLNLDELTAVATVSKEDRI